MIELGEIKLKNRDSVLEARNKIHTLARDLRFDSITAARLASVSSDIIRKMAYTDKDNRPGIIITLDQMKATEHPVLKLKYVSKGFGLLEGLRLPDSLFDGVTTSGSGEDVTYIEVFMMLPDPGFKPTKDFIAGASELVGRLTREELYQELEASYAKLRSQSLQIIHTERLRTLGTMAAGIAHELNNPMMGILNYVQYCLKHTAADNKKHPVLRDAEKEIRRCIYIVDNLLAFSRTEKVDSNRKENANCASIIDRILRLLSYKISTEHVSITRKYAEKIPAILIDVNKIEQVFLNLFNNALDAMKRRDKKEIHIEMQRKGNYLHVSIADTGIGINPGDIPKIFDPFFTTKEPGKGTGLGLSIVSSIIQEHAGKIECESEPGQGTTFKIFLPIFFE
ncbi:MAG: GHKL domain-containing protein [Candidatus Aminicenantes bacterium]|nr:GHKL domain-containing protein [Candidatus Aminicenantes bacterium]NIM78241.1 GHKL domain-containing protein [Candidatus Aminicenantes bacterium]NIN23747.1 GHKL domain-containing protein [Candidatus Aminicenantes bacterium]NIN47454.1 GHKL domain-containing protein [Candidatus Aminicenantes bacterium]NIN90382.1 GHKL domain-containing protein [Candidatus Aminicenantes bacterium]